MSYQPKHRRCLRPKHHQWGPVRQTLSGWSVTTCLMCGETEIL